MFYTTAYPKRRRKSIANNNDFGRVLNHLLKDTIQSVATPSNRPAANVKETEDTFVLELAVPGLTKKDIHINIEKDLLTVSATKETVTKEGETVKRSEFNFNDFKRSFQLPDTVNAELVKAGFKNGILSITLPKKEEATPRQIEIS